ncbi:MAG: hypothetical protein MK212_05760 [Saprospiraceae bacterium]|nr:hypothetical protein [Saprospiraceae bacterium]
MLGQILLIVGSLMFFILFFGLLLVARAHHKVKQGIAIVRTGVGGGKAAYNSGIFIIPVFHSFEEMDISMKYIDVACLGEEGIFTKDGFKANVKARFQISVKHDFESIIETAQMLGCEQASDQATLDKLFKAIFQNALTVCTEQFDFLAIDNDKTALQEAIANHLAKTDINWVGFELHQSTIEEFKQISLAELEKSENIRDIRAYRRVRKSLMNRDKLSSKVFRN